MDGSDIVELLSAVLATHRPGPQVERGRAKPVTFLAGDGAPAAQPAMAIAASTGRNPGPGGREDFRSTRG